ncbi:hypothetical protein D3C74_175060 [compost metagenome]
MCFNQIIKVCGDVDHGENQTGFYGARNQGLEPNPSVLRVSEKNITYSPAFKIAAVQNNQAGRTPMEIFVQANLTLN